MCIYTVKKQKKILKFLRGVRDPTKRPKIRRLRCKRINTAKTNKD